MWYDDIDAEKNKETKQKNKVKGFVAGPCCWLRKGAETPVL